MSKKLKENNASKMFNFHDFLHDFYVKDIFSVQFKGCDVICASKCLSLYSAPEVCVVNI